MTYPYGQSGPQYPHPGYPPPAYGAPAQGGPGSQPHYGGAPAYGPAPAYGQAAGMPPTYGTPVAPPGYPPAYGPAPGYARPAGPPSGGTALTAAFLAVVLGVLVAVSGGITIEAGNTLWRESGKNRDAIEGTSHALQATGGLQLVIAALWGLAALLLMNRNSAGRIMLLVLSGVSVVGGVVGAIVGAVNGAPMAIAGGGFGVTMALLVLCLVLAQSTTRWLAAPRPPKRYSTPVDFAGRANGGAAPGPAGFAPPGSHPVPPAQRPPYR